MNEYACNEHAAEGGCGGGFDFAYRLAGAARRLLLTTTGTRGWTLNPSLKKEVGRKMKDWLVPQIWEKLLVF